MVTYVNIWYSPVNLGLLELRLCCLKYMFLSAVVFGDGKLDIQIGVKQYLSTLAMQCNLILSSLIVHSNPGRSVAVYTFPFDSCD